MDWSEPSVYGETSDVHHKYSVAVAEPSDAEAFLHDAPIKKMRWTKMLPGGFIVPHIDATPYNVRWQLPLEPAGFWWADGEITEPTEPFRAEHWKPHAVWNPTTRDRIHLVVDLEYVPMDVPIEHPLVLCDLFPEMEAFLHLEGIKLA